MFINFIFLLIGFALLIKGADLFVNNASLIATRTGISQLTIGLTIVAFGTSAPELVVNIFSSFRKENEMVVGNILGSNIFNTLVILGLTSFIRPISVHLKSVKREIPFSILAGLLVFIFITDFFSGQSLPILSRIESFLLILLFAGYMYYLLRTRKEENSTETTSKPQGRSIPTIVLLLLTGLLALVTGGRLVVNNSVDIAVEFGLSQRIIGITILAVGTSLPELVTSILAAIRGNSDLALGNVIGSNIFNLLFVFTVSGLIFPVAFRDIYYIDFILFLFSSLLLMLFMFTGKRKVIDRWEGILFFLIFVIYMTYTIA